MLYIKREVHESVDEYVMNSDDILSLIERVFGDEFRREVESKIGNKDRIIELERDIAYGDERYEELAGELECKSEEVDILEKENIEIETRVMELEKELGI